MSTTPTSRFPNSHDGDQHLIDERTLAELIDERPESRPTVLRFVTEFCDSLPVMCERMRAATFREDRSALYELAFSISSSARLIGATQLAEDAAALEAVADSAAAQTCLLHVIAVRATAAETAQSVTRALASLRETA